MRRHAQRWVPPTWLRGAILLSTLALLAAGLAWPASAVESTPPATAGTPNVWSSAGPAGGLVSTIAIDPSNTNTVYAATSNAANTSTLAKSTDGGATWGLLAVGVFVDVITDLIINPANTQTLYAPTNSIRIYRSTDGAATWAAIDMSININTIAVSLTSPTTLYAAALDGVYTSDNNGDTWTRTSTGLPDATAVQQLVAVPGALYAGTAGKGIYRSTDGGASWGALNGGLPDSAIVSSLAVDPTNTAKLYAAVASGVYSLNTTGDGWDLVVSGGVYPFKQLLVDPQEPTTLYATNEFDPYKLNVSTGTLAILDNGLSAVYVPDLALVASSPATLYAATWSGVYKSTDAGASWSERNTGLLATAVFAMAVDPTSPTTLYAGTCGGVFKSDDSAATWGLQAAGLPQRACVTSLAVHPTTRDIVYAGFFGALYRSANGGAAWAPLATAGLPATGGRADLTVDPLNPSTLYARIGGPDLPGVYKSSDDGATWILASGGIPAADLGELTTLVIDPTTPTTLYAGSRLNGLYKTTDGGARWSPINTGLQDQLSIYALAVDPVNPAILYTIAASLSSQTFSSIYKSTDGGASWQLARESLGTFISTLLVDPTNHTTVYAGVRNGVYRSTDSGANWSPFTNGVAVPSVTALALIPSSPIAIYAGTRGGGVYSLQFSIAGVSVSAPAGAVADGPFAVTATVLANNGGTASDYNGPVTLTLRGGTSTLEGAASTNAVNGVASFSGLRIPSPGSGYQIAAAAGDLAGGISPLFSVATTAQTGAGQEQEPNNQLEAATPLLLDATGKSSYSGLIDSAADVDLFSFTAQPGSSVELGLKNLPADYDLLLLSDPRDAEGRNDDTDVGNVSDIARFSVARFSVARFSVARFSVGVAAQPGTADETVRTFLTRGGRYFALVASPAGEFNAAPYSLSISLREGSLAQSVIGAQAGRGVRLARDTNVRTLFVANRPRMAARYPGADASLSALDNLLAPGGSLMAASAGVRLELTAGLDAAASERLAALYTRWDAAPDQPLLANEVAQQIWLLLDKAIGTYYPNTTDIVLVGGDDVIPFYRVPDETDLGNEGDYYAELQREGALRDGTPLAGSLRFQFYQTDDFYADRKPTPWRGRALYVPDQAIGRLVERPEDIVRYLNGYAASNGYTINPGQSGAALVTGYDFLTDQAEQIAATLGAFGYSEGGASPLTRLIGPNWNAQQLEQVWFGGQLPQLSGAYSGIATPHQLMSVNSHFSHYDAVPASLEGGTFFAQTLLDPTALDDASAFFKSGGAPSLVYSVGCHAGLSASDDALTAPRFQADFAQAVLKQGGNWIGNTGYGIGDSDVVAYSERLALLFTRALGREISLGGAYAGAPLGESLALAKRQYLQTSGASAFGVFDEKIMSELTLYGLPFIRVKVPAPQPLAALDPPPIPASVRAQLTATGGVFTRQVAITVEYAPLANASAVPQIAGATVADDFSPAPRELIVSTTSSEGRPILPALVYDLTLQANPDGSGIGSPQVRGVRLVSATSLPDIANFNPHVTTPITDQISLQALPDAPLEDVGVWLPARPYTFQRTVAVVPGGDELVGGRPADVTDKLIVMPTQLRADDAQRGRLRRFTRMTFEVSYVDPRSATAEVFNQTSGPAFDSLAVIFPRGGPSVPQAGVTLRAHIAGGGSAKQVSATYTADGQSWQRVSLESDGGGFYAASVPSQAAARDFAAFFEALDNAGNAGVDATKGSPGEPVASGRVVYLPLVER